MKTHAQLQNLLTKLEVALATVTGLKVTELAITNENLLVVTFIFGRNIEEVVFLTNEEWNQPFFVVMQTVLDKVASAPLVPRSTMSH